MSKQTYFSKYESPNIVIVPTVSFCNSSPSKNARLDDTTNRENQETVTSIKSSYPTPEIVIKKTEQSKDSNIVKAEEYVIKQTMLSSGKVTSPVSETVKIKTELSKAAKDSKFEENVRKKTSPGKITNPVPVKRRTEHSRGKKDVKKGENFRKGTMSCSEKITTHMETEENVDREIISSSENSTNPPLRLLSDQTYNQVPHVFMNQLKEFKNSCSVKNDENIKNETLTEKVINQLPEIFMAQLEDSKDKNNVKIKACNKKVNTSWASNYMQSIGQIQKESTRITVNRSKTHKSQKIDDVSTKTSEDAKTMKHTLQNEAFKDHNKSAPEKSSKLPQKTRKCKKIKLEITVVFQEPTLSSSDSDSNDDHDEEDPYVHADMSFLEDINVDEIVKSLCENISTKEEGGSCSALNDNLKENNNTEGNEVSKELKNKIDCGKENLVTLNEKIKIEPKSSVSNNNNKESLQSKINIIKNETHNVIIKAKDEPQTPCLRKVSPLTLCLDKKPDNPKEKHQISSLVIELDDAKRRPYMPMMVAIPENAKDQSKINLDDDDKNLQTFRLANILPNVKEKSPLPNSMNSEDPEVKPLTRSLMVRKDETKEQPVTTSLVSKLGDAKEKPLTSKLLINSENANDKSPSPNRVMKLNDTKDQQLTPSLLTKPDYSCHNSRSPIQPLKQCLAKHFDNRNEKSETSSPVAKPINIKDKPTTQHLYMKPENAKTKPRISVQAQTPTSSINSDKAKEEPQTPCLLLKYDKVLAEKLESRLFQYLNEKFMVISNIRKGRYSLIYHIKDSINKNYAVKIINKECNRFILGVNKENMLMQLQKDIPSEKFHFVYLHNGFSMKGYWCFLMDFYPKNLHQALQENDKPFHIDKVQDLARQLVTAVTILRNNNIVHSDIKPGHILMNCANDTLKICGFDTSYYINAVNLLPNIGTVNYRAPEIIIGHSAGFSIDVWATALVMYEMATNIKLFPGSYNNDILYKQICTLGTIPYHMVQKSLFRHNHFYEGKFIRRVGLNGKKAIILDQFYKNNKLQNSIFRAYQHHWCKSRSKAQQKCDIEKLGLFHQLLEQMLMLNPTCRLGIEFVYANRFIYEFC